MSDSEKNMPTNCCSCFTLLGMKTTYYLALATYINKLQEQSVDEVASSNRIKFESYGTLFNEAYFIFNENLVDNQYHFGQMENDQTAEAFYEDDINIDETQENGNSALSGLCQHCCQMMKFRKRTLVSMLNNVLLLI